MTIVFRGYKEESVKSDILAKNHFVDLDQIPRMGETVMLHVKPTDTGGIQTKEHFTVFSIIHDPYDKWIDIHCYHNAGKYLD